MSGFAGVFMRNGSRPDAAAVAAMAAPVPYRSTAGRSEVSDGPFCGLILRSTTTPEPPAAEPFLPDETDAVMLFDGRLDNREELADALRLPRAAWADKSDERLALAAWKAWREEAPERLLGDFAFVVWNRKRRSVFCARDPMGVRPLFYFLSEWVFIFASEVRQVLAHPLVPQAPDETMVGELLAGELRRGSDRTLYQAVRRVPHAHRLVVDADAVRLERYWTPDLGRELKLADDEEYAEAFREAFDRAVAARLRSRTPIGAYLSGGLDSTAVVVTARALGGHERPGLTTFSLVFPGHPEADERKYSDAVVAHAGVVGVPLVPEPPRASEFRAQVAARRELPDFPHDYAGNAIRRAMRQRGIEVALTGSGGDTGLSGSHFHYADQLRAFRVIAFWRRYVDVARQPAMGWTSADILRGAVWPLVPAFVRARLRPLARRAGGSHPPPWIRPEFAARVGLNDLPPLRVIPPGQLARTDVHDAFENGWARAALDWYQRGSAEWGIEDRHPFFDRRMVEFALSLPDEQRWQRGRTRYIVRNALGSRLPALVRDRPDDNSGDFSHLYVQALEALGGRRWFAGKLETAAIGWIVPDVLDGMYQRMCSLHRAGDPSYGDVAFRLWIVAALEMWYSDVFGRSPGETRWSSESNQDRVRTRTAPSRASRIGGPS